MSLAVMSVQCALATPTHWLAWLLHKKHWAMAERWIGMVDHPTLTFADSQANDHFTNIYDSLSLLFFPSKQDGK